MHVHACECTEARGVVEIGAETAAQAAWSAQGAAVGLQEGVHAEGTPRTSHWTPQTTTAANWHGLWEGGEGRRTTHRGNEDEEKGGKGREGAGKENVNVAGHIMELSVMDREKKTEQKWKEKGWIKKISVLWR